MGPHLIHDSWYQQVAVCPKSARSLLHTVRPGHTRPCFGGDLGPKQLPLGEARPQQHSTEFRGQSWVTVHNIVSISWSWPISSYTTKNFKPPNFSPTPPLKKGEGPHLMHDSTWLEEGLCQKWTPSSSPFRHKSRLSQTDQRTDVRTMTIASADSIGRPQMPTYPWALAITRSSLVFRKVSSNTPKVCWKCNKRLLYIAFWLQWWKNG